MKSIVKVIEYVTFLKWEQMNVNEPHSIHSIVSFSGP